jgi:L-fuconolactonase
MIVDSHVHASNDWFEPIETLLFQMDRNHVDKAVLIKFEGSFDNSYELECVRKYPGRFGAVVKVDNKRPDALQKLETWAEKGALGIRLSASERSPGQDPLAIWRKSSELGLPVSCHGSIEMFASSDFRNIVKEFPDLKIVMEHLGGVSRTAAFPNPDLSLLNRILELAHYPNIYIKLPGLGELLPRPFPFKSPAFDSPPPVVKQVYDAFGSRHIMWGSDFPPCAHREGYTNVLRFPMEKTPFFTREDKDWIFGKTALSVWNIKDA